MAKEYIEREAVLRTIGQFKRGFRHMEERCAIDGCMLEIMTVPAADVVEVKHGRWEKTEDDFYMGLTIFECSVCREEWVFEDMFDVDGLNYHYCPNCGAKMDGGLLDELLESKVP